MVSRISSDGKRRHTAVLDAEGLALAIAVTKIHSQSFAVKSSSELEYAIQSCFYSIACKKQKHHCTSSAPLQGPEYSIV